MKKFICIFIAIWMLFCLFGCQSQETEDSVVSEVSSAVSESEPEPEPVPEPSSEVSSEPEEVYDGPVNPLTGEPVEKDISMNRPYAVMLNNHAAAQPQHGVSQASILFEMPVEGGITRMMAVFQDVSNVDVIGSVRSSRHDFLDLVQWLDAVYIHAGGSTYAYNAIYNRGIANVDGVNGIAEIFYRDSDRRYSMGYEHSLMTTGAEILRCVPTYGYRMEHEDGYSAGLTFEEAPVLSGGQAAQSCTLHFSGSKTTSFAYDAGSEAYLASQYGTAYVDGNTGKQVGFSNVIVIFTDMYVMDSVGRVELSMNSSGSGLYFCNGQCASISWYKCDADQPYVFTYENGDSVALKTGSTYIGVIPSDQWVDY